jgi:hypothetical protein
MGGTLPKELQRQKYEVDREILEIHNNNVNTAMQNLQFVFSKVMELATDIGRNLPQTLPTGTRGGISGFFKAPK